MDTEKNREEDFFKTGQYIQKWNRLMTEIITSYLTPVLLILGREGV